jgi:hypothetical protein
VKPVDEYASDLDGGTLLFQVGYGALAAMTLASAAQSCSAQSPVLIPGRPLGGPVVHRVTGSSASPSSRLDVGYSFAVQPVRPQRPAPRRPRDGQW